MRVRGKPSPKVAWYKDGEEINDEQFPHIKLFQEEDLYSILITEGKFEDAGQYKVTAKNDLGEVSSTANLFVEGVFTTVTRPTAFCSGTAAKLRITLGFVK